MPFNHYAKIRRILKDEPPGWYIRRIDKPTTAKNFKGELTHFTHYYRIYNDKNQAIKFCKFQQLELLATVLKVPSENLPIISDS